MEDSGIDSDPKVGLGDELLFQGNLSDSSNSSTNNNITNSLSDAPRSNARQLHKKLEQRIQEAKKLQKAQDHKKSSAVPNLIPIQRLSIPSKAMAISKEEVPLVDWDTEDSEEEDIHFFPKTNVKQELTDTFSIEEFEVSPDEDDLNLNPPKPVGYHRLSFCCYSVEAKCSIL